MEKTIRGLGLLGLGSLGFRVFRGLKVFRELTGGVRGT